MCKCENDLRTVALAKEGANHHSKETIALIKVAKPVPAGPVRRAFALAAEVHCRD